MSRYHVDIISSYFFSVYILGSYNLSPCGQKITPGGLAWRRHQAHATQTASGPAGRPFVAHLGVFWMGNGRCIFWELRNQMYDDLCLFSESWKHCFYGTLWDFAWENHDTYDIFGDMLPLFDLLCFVGCGSPLPHHVCAKETGQAVCQALHWAQKTDGVWTLRK